MPDNDTFQSFRPSLEVAAAETIKNIESSTGQRVSPENVLWLQSAAKDLVRPDRESPKLCDLPTSVGGVFLWPFTYWSRNWFCEVALPIYGMDQRAIAFTLAHSMDKETLEKIATQKQLKIAINVWLDTLLCGPVALSDAVDRILGRDELVTVKKDCKEKTKATRAEDWGDTVAMLCEKYPGTTPIWWATRVSMDYCIEHAMRVIADLPTESKPSFNAVCRFHEIADHIRKEMTDGNA
ncbi:MAG: hypothetical protein ACOYOU_03350 [Kiritimatiellia bacterium]